MPEPCIILPVASEVGPAIKILPSLSSFCWYAICAGKISCSSDYVAQGVVSITYSSNARAPRSLAIALYSSHVGMKISPLITNRCKCCVMYLANFYGKVKYRFYLSEYQKYSYFILMRTQTVT